MTASRTRSWWGWGWEDQALTDDECTGLAAFIPGLPDRPLPTPVVRDVTIPPPRVSPPGALAPWCRTDPADRLGHAYGKAYRDVIRALQRRVDAPPDFVAHPPDEAGVSAVLDWAASADVAVVPYGAGSSVVGGVECAGDGYRGVVSLDLTALDRVLEVDRASLAARIQGGALGPALEDQLRPMGLTLRHFPQSFEFSTLGGWLATRSGGHYATLHTHIDDFVESMRVVTPAGVCESWRLPGSGAGPSPDRLFLGSEGTLGVITEAWMRVQERPSFRRSTSVSFGSAEQAFAAVRAIAQSGLHPANARLLDPGEAGMSGASRTGDWMLVLGVESAHFPVDESLDLLVDLARDHGGISATPKDTEAVDHAPQRDASAEAWRSTFLRMPYVRDGMARMSAIVETFETATTWDRIAMLYEDVRSEMADAIVEVTGAPGLVNTRFTHVYPDGVAPYFTVIAAGRRGDELAMWDELKVAAMESLTRHRATVTHHHAVGRDHRPGYDKQRPAVFAAALQAAKTALDPRAILNPGVLIDPKPS